MDDGGVEVGSLMECREDDRGRQGRRALCMLTMVSMGVCIYIIWTFNIELKLEAGAGVQLEIDRQKIDGGSCWSFGAGASHLPLRTTPTASWPIFFLGVQQWSWLASRKPICEEKQRLNL